MISDERIAEKVTAMLETTPACNSDIQQMAKELLQEEREAIASEYIYHAGLMDGSDDRTMIRQEHLRELANQLRQAQEGDDG